MGKKKRGGGGGGKRNKGRGQSKDHHHHDSHSNDDVVSEEITVLCSIFQEECKVVSESPPQIILKIRPYSKDTGYDDLDISVLLSVRYLPGYPHKCPKLHIIPEKGLCKDDADKLLSLLHDQANSNAREGRVMIYSLVEAAQEFLSEIKPADLSPKSVPCSSGQMFRNDAAVSQIKKSSSGGPFVYGFVDLFSSSGESWHWGVGIDGNSGPSSSLHTQLLDGPKLGLEAQKKEISRTAKSLAIQGTKTSPSPFSTAKLETLEEESEDDNKSISTTSESSRSSKEVFAENDTFSEKEDFSLEESMDENDPEGESSSESFSVASGLDQDQASQNVQRDLVMVHLLHLGCASKGILADALPDITTELYNLGIFSERARDLAAKPSSFFNKTFDHVFREHKVSSKLSQFWKPASEIADYNTSSPSSRYLNDFEELQSLGHGGFGHVVLCKNKLDGRQYAVKKIRLKGPLNDRILREVATLSRLQHQHVVRYYQAWFETGVAGGVGETSWGSMTAASSSFSYKDASSTDIVGQDDKLESTYLYIQMEYCPRTLRQVFESYSHFDKELAWHLFRQIVEGLAHIHGQGIIHRDLTPNNIFFDARNDIKIGDFGLAKFLKLEQFDQDPGLPADTTVVSIDRTGQVGTYFYTAPEIEQGWLKIDEKADMYSSGIVFLELWHPFTTAMERHIVLSDLKKGELPSTWVAEFPEQASLLRCLTSLSPSDRPSATELLQNAFPPRMENELLDNILRTMRSSEDSSVYDKVVNAIFDEEMLSSKDHHQAIGKIPCVGNETASHQCTDLDTELRDYVNDVTREVFRQHCAKHLEILPMNLLDDSPQYNRNTVKILTHGGDILELCHELRRPFVNWVIGNQKSSFKRYEVSYVHRRAIGHSTPYRYLQGDLDIIGGAPGLTESEVIKVAMDIVTHFFHLDLCDIHLNHGDLLDAIWNWTGIKSEQRQKVAELLSIMGSLRPQSSERKSKWVLIRRQLLQELDLAEAVVNRLQTVGLRFCGPVDQALPRLRGALSADKSTGKALDELSDLFNYLRVWKIEKHVFIDALMTPTEVYHRDLFFQIYLMKENTSGSLIEGSLLATGGRYDYMLHQMWDREYKSKPPGGVGTSIALETVIQYSSTDIKPLRNEATISVLVCSRGGGGLLEERMELVVELWDKNIKAQYVPMTDPSLTEQYEYANEHDIKCLVIITESVSQTGFLKVRHLELKKEKELERENLVKFLLEATAKNLRNPSIWN